MKKTAQKLVCIYALVSLLNGCSNSPEGNIDNDTAPLIRIAQKARASGNPDAAINFYNKVLQIDSENTQALLGLAELYIDTNLLDAAETYIKKATQNKHDKKTAKYLSGKICLLKGDSKKAEKLFLESGSIDALNALGTIYDEQEKHTKAQEMYKKVISLNPNYIDAYNNLGLSLLLCEKYKEAIFYLENACSLREANVTYRSNLALAYGLSGYIEKAKKIYAQDFEGEELNEKVAYLEDLLSTRLRSKQHFSKYQKSL